MELGPGEVVVAPPGRAVIFRTGKTGEVKLHYFHFQPEWLTSLLTVPERTRFAALADAPDRRISHLAARHDGAREFGRVCELAAHEAPLLTRYQMLKLAVAAFEPVLKPPPGPPSTLTGARARFVELMEQTPEAELLRHSPNELARECRCSVRHFKRLFRAHCGVSFRARQTGLRLETARQLLCESDAMVREVARSSNYRNLGLFNAMFKRHFGMTPTQFRRNQAAPALRFQKHDGA